MAGASSLGASCPKGGTFYTCQDSATEFLGCCTSNPCTAEAGGKCPQNNIRPTSFSSDSYDEILPQKCDSSEPEALWYVCKFNNPPFMGCCKSNPCASGSCPAKDLAAAVLADEPESRQIFLGEASTPTMEVAKASPTSQSNITQSSAPTTGSSGGGLSTGAIAGIAAGGAVLVLALIVFCVLRFRRKATWNNNTTAGVDQISGFDSGEHTQDYKPVVPFSPYGSSSYMPPHLPTPQTFQYAPVPSQISPYQSPLPSPYDPPGNKMNVASHVSHLSNGSQATANAYVAYPPSSAMGNPNFAELSGNTAEEERHRRYSELQ